MPRQREHHADSRYALDSVVLLLNADYEPLNVCDLRRAFRLVFGAKAEVIEYDHTEVRTPTEVLRAPSVIKLQYRIKRPRPRVRLSRREVFARDGHSCQYCGERTTKLTIDHVPGLDQAHPAVGSGGQLGECGSPRRKPKSHQHDDRHGVQCRQ